MLSLTTRGSYYISDLFTKHEIVHGFTTRNSPSLDHIFPTLPIVYMNQVHGTSIHHLSSSYTQTILEVDGVVTETKNTVLAVKTADCVPVLYADTRLGRVAASHQGWKGTYDNMAGKMIDEMCDKGSKKEDIIVAIGPAVGPCCYGVRPDDWDTWGKRIRMFQKRYSHWKDSIIVEGQDITSVDLVQLNVLQLHKSGIADAHIDRGIFCTSCQEDEFYSYFRGDRNKRQYSFIMQS